MATIMQTILEKELQGNTNRFGIYRLQNTEKNRYYAFCSLEALKAIQMVPKKEMYALIYVGAVNKATDLEKIFEVFNLNHPKDFLCASLSVGDVIAIHKESELKAYFVNSVGFSELPDFFGGVGPLTSKCPICGGLSEPGEKLCGRCLLLQNLLGEYPTLEKIAVAFWDHCFACESEIIASVRLTPDSLVIQCDNCGEIHTIPFREEDILRYLRSGIIREMVVE